jgi:hypothetical protein
MNAELIEIAEALKYSKIERLRSFSKNVTPDGVNDIFKASISEPYAIVFLKSKLIQITPYGTRLSIVYSHGKKVDNYLLAHPDLTDKFLRQIFTGFELVLYKVCHIHIYEQSREYHWETEKTRQRIRKVKKLVAIDNWQEYLELFDEIFFVRDAFAHSFIDIDDIKYRHVRLADCFGDSYLGRSMRSAAEYGGRIFMDDVAALFAPIMSVFETIQLKQIDERKFAKLCDRLMTSRSLEPGP